MSFGESVFSAGFYHKTAKEDLFVKANHVYSQRDRRGKTLEDSGEKFMEAGHMSLSGRPAPRAYLSASPLKDGSPPPLRSYLRR